MQHINLSNYKGSITDWTELNYINGGLADNLADIANIKVNDNCYNYLAKSVNLIKLNDVAETTTPNGLTYKVENGVITTSGTLTADETIYFRVNVPAGVYSFNGFSAKNVQFRGPNNAYIGGWNTFNARTFSNGILNISLYYQSGATANDTIKPMLTTGSTAPTAYEPYGALVIHQNAIKIPFTSLDFTRVSTPEQGIFRAEIDGLGIKVPEPRTIPNSYIKGYIPYPWNPLSEYDDGKYGYGIRASSQKLTLAIIDKNYINNLNGFIQANINNNFIAELATPQIIVLKSVDLGTLT